MHATVAIGEAGGGRSKGRRAPRRRGGGGRGRRSGRQSRLDGELQLELAGWPRPRRRRGKEQEGGGERKGSRVSAGAVAEEEDPAAGYDGGGTAGGLREVTARGRDPNTDRSTAVLGERRRYTPSDRWARPFTARFPGLRGLGFERFGARSHGTFGTFAVWSVHYVNSTFLSKNISVYSILSFHFF
jgi:hypothetical protein